MLGLPHQNPSANITLAPGNLLSTICLASLAVLPSSATFIGPLPVIVTQK